MEKKQKETHETCLWCKYGTIKHDELKIECGKDKSMNDKYHSCSKWRYGF